MNTAIERNLGEQPIAGVMKEAGLKGGDLVGASSELLTFKMVSKACKGRRLTINVQSKVLNALNKVTGKSYELNQLFTY